MSTEVRLTRAYNLGDDAAFDAALGEIQRLRAAIAELVRFGAPMALGCRCLSKGDLPDGREHREEMRRLYRGWDDAVASIPPEA